MALLLCSPSSPTISLQSKPSWNTKLHRPCIGVEEQKVLAFRSIDSEVIGMRIAGLGNKIRVQWSFLGGSRVIIQPKVTEMNISRKSSTLSASWLTSSQIACSAFTWGTIAVLPFYTLMVLAPNTDLTRRSMESSIPYVLLGVLYAYLLYLSWTPDTLRAMFASKYWLPELPAIARMFSNEMTVSSAWIHLLAVDLFAARQVFHDGLKNKIETRHSVSLCLLFCPVGIATHVITKVLTQMAKRSH
ncbi:hypothetical protein J5N97_027839 [Dioscorea zingiberensis]|uniref:Neoxanthin synthase n=1 Tax=Dioscorea zingiberensis TaxID=325984 RepID=A0A9D5H487_9LILI|nr:hypothetical protein J5N97_027839 [Dioscorea zingiberensis]